MRRMQIFLALSLALLSIPAVEAAAHPLGNFSVNQYSALRIGKAEIEIRYVVDMAEIPTFQEIQETGLVPKTDDASVKPYAARKAESLRARLSLEVDGQPVAMRMESQEIIFPEGAGGLPTLKIGLVYKGKLAADVGGAYSLKYRDDNFPGRAGWKEVIAEAAPGVKLLNSSVPEGDRSARLSDYPTDLLNSPPQQLAAQVNFAVTPLAAALDVTSAASKPASAETEAATTKTRKTEPNRSAPEIRPGASITQANPAAKDSMAENPLPLKANRQSTPRSSFTEIMAKGELGLGMILAALAVAAALGAFHALEPGHGKTLVAAYLIGSRGTAKHALLLGIIVTASHTAAVYLLGGMVLYASEYVVPEKLYPWLALASGVMILVLGILLFLRRLHMKKAAHHHHHHGHHDHSHLAGYGHAHGSHHSHGHSHEHRDHAVSLRELLTLGISGGIVPCPAALVVLLSAVSLHRVGFGLLLIVAFSLGLAAVLIAIGLLMVYAGRAMSRFHGNGQLITRWLPLASSAFIVLFGIGLTWQALASAGFIRL